MPGGPDVFFHFKDLAPGLAFDEQLVQRRVTFDVEAGERGPRARGVSPAQ